MRRTGIIRIGLAVTGLALGLTLAPASSGVAAPAKSAAAGARASCLPGGDAVRSAAAIGSGAVRTAGRGKGGDARSVQDTPTLTAAERVEGERLLAQAADKRSTRRAAATVEVPVFFNILQSGDPRWKNYWASQTSLASTITVLNQKYAGAGFHFTNTGYRYWGQTSWYRATPGSSADIAMRRTLHRGDKTTLNIYMVYPADKTLGWSSLPQDGLTGAALLQDGVAIDLGTAPGGRIAGYNQGKTAVHEVGHWLSLFHTFDGYGYFSDGGCNPNAGDEVADTPAQRSPTIGCPSYRDSCSAPGADPIHNFLDYSNDPCMTNFTAGQQDRMQAAWDVFRAS